MRNYRIALLPALLSVAFVLWILPALDAQASTGSEAARRDYDRGNYAAALQKLQPLTEAGDASAEVLLGTMYANGKGVPKDDAQAAAWFWKAAIVGNSDAQLALSAAYADGRGVAQSDDIANYWRWKVATAQLCTEKDKLYAELAKLAAPNNSKDSAPVIDPMHCQAPAYRRAGYGYRHSETLQILFLVDPAGKIMETSLLERSDWASLDHDFLVSYSKTCTFKPAMKNGKPVSGLYKLQASWSVEP